MSRRSLNALAARFRELRPAAGDPRRRVWADMVNATTGSGIVPESYVRDFREIAGLDMSIDRAGVMPEGGDMRQGLSPAAHDVLDAVDNLRAGDKPPAQLRNAARAVLSLTPGNAPAARLSDVTAAAYLLLAAERSDAESGS